MQTRLRPGRGHWLLARRATVADLAWTAGSRWHIEECFQQAKNEAGWTTTRSVWPYGSSTHCCTESC